MEKQAMFNVELSLQLRKIPTCFTFLPSVSPYLFVKALLLMSLKVPNPRG